MKTVHIIHFLPSMWAIRFPSPSFCPSPEPAPGGHSESLGYVGSKFQFVRDIDGHFSQEDKTQNRGIQHLWWSKSCEFKLLSNFIVHWKLIWRRGTPLNPTHGTYPGMATEALEDLKKQFRIDLQSSASLPHTFKATSSAHIHSHERTGSRL